MNHFQFHNHISGMAEVRVAKFCMHKKNVLALRWKTTP